MLLTCRKRSENNFRRKSRIRKKSNKRVELMKQQISFSSRVGDRWSLAVEFEGIGDPPKLWNEWGGSLWLWVNGLVVGRPAEIEMVMTGLDSLVESAQATETRTNVLLLSLPANESLDLVMWAQYGEGRPPKHFTGE